MALLLHSTAERQAVWGRVFAEAGEALIPSLDAITDPALVTEIACWLPPAGLERWPNLRTVISVGAGVDHMPALPPGVALSRTLAPGIEAQVRDWVVMATLMLHREMPAYLAQGRAGRWAPRPVRANREARVGILGLGRIGQKVAETLGGLGFAVAGYSRLGAAVPQVSGMGVAVTTDLSALLASSDLLICLLPLTDQTRGLLNDDLFAQLPEGAALIHAGRGAQLDMAALERALKGGRLRAAMLDVTDPEPLPEGHWAWADERLIITPHIAAHTDAAEGAAHALAVVRANRAGLAVPGLVDPARGY